MGTAEFTWFSMSGQVEFPILSQSGLTLHLGQHLTSGSFLPLPPDTMTLPEGASILGVLLGFQGEGPD